MYKLNIHMYKEVQKQIKDLYVCRCNITHISHYSHNSSCASLKYVTFRLFMHVYQFLFFKYIYGHIYTRHNTTKKNWHVMIKTKKEKNNNIY